MAVMGFLSNSRKQSGANLYEKEVKPQLVAQDGKVHIVMINSFSKFLNNLNFGVETKYTEQVGTIINHLQDDGYEIVDIKFDSLKNLGLLGDMEGFHTLIMYK
ncbi:hypothetical protein FC23_GL001047 [Lactobacillus psittaci DSM 15354]|uniref:Uncharacterized protein n=2 Tax=Lactobacillus TaxID=1578 RepID=A0A0R1S6G4_9LACO|nr:hypothetical protein FC23_GL001047 [Lactobacillus psittaci DSM 15354]